MDDRCKRTLNNIVTIHFNRLNLAMMGMAEYMEYKRDTFVKKWKSFWYYETFFKLGVHVHQLMPTRLIRVNQTPEAPKKIIPYSVPASPRASS